MNSDTQSHIVNCISSHKTGDSEIQQKAINLGKKLVHELESENDTLSCWMAHYIGEQISTAEAAEDDEKTIAKQRCFETVLRLWQHRSELPDGRRPFERFESIFRALEALDPENPDPYYVRRNSYLSHEQDDGLELQLDDIQKWLVIANVIDKSSRELINYAFKQAANNASDEKTKDWLANSINSNGRDDVSILVRFLSKDLTESEENERINRERTESLQSKVEDLDTLVNICNSLRSAWTEELCKINVK